AIRTRKPRAAAASRSAWKNRPLRGPEAENGNEYLDADHRTTGEPGIQVRVRHRCRTGRRAARPDRRHRASDFREEAGAGLAARVAPQIFSHVAKDDRADVEQCAVRADRLSAHHLLRRSEKAADAAESRRSRPGDPPNLRKAGNSARGTE